MKKLGIFTFLIFILPIFAGAVEVSNRTGFVDGSVWFSKETIKENDSVKVYTAVFNGESKTLNASVDFFDGDTLLSQKKISVNPQETKTVYIDWKVSLGSHKIFAKISQASVSGEKALLERDSTKSVSFSVTKDVPASVAKKALSANVKNILKPENLKLETANSWIKENFKQSEIFREKNSEKFKTKKEEVKKDRKEQMDDKEAKVPVKVLITLHLIALIAVVFIFSVPVVFYLISIILIYTILRFVWIGLKKIFRKNHDE